MTATTVATTMAKATAMAMRGVKAVAKVTAMASDLCKAYGEPVVVMSEDSDDGNERE